MSVEAAVLEGADAAAVYAAAARVGLHADLTAELTCATAGCAPPVARSRRWRTSARR